MEDKNSSQNPGAINPNDNIVRNWLTGIAIVLVILIAVTYIIHRNDTMSPIAGDMSSSSTMMDDEASSTGATSAAAATATTMPATTGSASMGSSVPAGNFSPLSGTLMTASQGEAIAAADQPAGSSVAISSMTLTRESWVAVMAKDGSILGAGLFPATATSGSIPLERDTVSGNSYKVVIYADTTGKTFDLHQDQLVSSNGSPVGAAFTAQ